MSAAPAALLTQRDGNVVRLTLNRPSAGNAIDLPLAQGLLQAAIECDEDDTVRCVLVTGAGRMFCVGGDVGGFAGAGDSAGVLLKQLTAALHMAIARLMHMKKPLVVAVNGPAAGAGLGLAMLGDLVLAARSAHFTMAYTAIGLTPDGATSWLLPRLVGLRRAQELTMTNRRCGAEEAVVIGLVTRLVEDDRLDDEALSLAHQLAAGSTSALGTARELLIESTSRTLESHLEAEARAIAAASRTPHGREGIAAFIGKRSPDYR